MNAELDIYKRQGFGNSSGFGTRPALLIVDFQMGFGDPRDHADLRLGELGQLADFAGSGSGQFHDGVSMPAF